MDCSDTGTMAPERCVFGIMLDVSAFLGNRLSQNKHCLGNLSWSLSQLSKFYFVVLGKRKITWFILPDCVHVCVKVWQPCTCATNKWRPWLTTLTANLTDWTCLGCCSASSAPLGCVWSETSRCVFICSHLSSVWCETRQQRVCVFVCVSACVCQSRRRHSSPCTWWEQCWPLGWELSTSWSRRCSRCTCSLTSTAGAPSWLDSPLGSGPCAASSAVSFTLVAAGN